MILVENLRAFTDSGAQIKREATELIKHRRDEDHTVGNGHFIKLEKLRDTHRQALLKILEGISIIAVTACATVAGIGSLEGKVEDLCRKMMYLLLARMWFRKFQMY